MRLLFNDKIHKYTDDFYNSYISCTTLIDKYTNKFSDKEVEIARACERIGRNNRHPKYLKYKNKSYKQILKEWEAIRVKACTIGSKKHDYLDTSIKLSNGFFDVFNSRYNINNNKYVELFTIDDIKHNPDVGILNIEYFIKSGIKDKYPQIFNIISTLINDGWKVYSEVGVFSVEYLISGQIDIIFIKNDSFIILDWKTNKNGIKFESGYWDKDNNGNTLNYVFKDEYFKSPLDNLPQSVGNKYTLQLSIYDYLVELFGYKYVANILCHITHDIYTYEDKEVVDDKSLLGKNKIKIIPIKYRKSDVQLLIDDNINSKNNGQLKLV